MKILAHRGYWEQPQEKNSYAALEGALRHGFGFETDIRDYCGRLVVSHNIADESCFDFEKALEAYSKMKSSAYLALNVKADGIQTLLKRLLDKHKITNYFVFDMSVPEQVVYEKQKFKFFTRQSDIEKQCVQYDQAEGVWLDAFYDDGWLNASNVRAHLDRGKKVCIVSPELHQRDYQDFWHKIGALKESPQLMLCTDRPEEARRYFEC